ncbi:ribonuclease H-like domain-containing protein [Sphaerosporella brunnea]|uniref:Ribonuclease H-like domain-containing protein n=1 Tax=Sphaerosporella brunnea TaxID=1250544 RepID=A0A5J5F963_9PEZI|nr:ribonuclease H-like domain-containing protein [Sphaerosporella brunnea]
MPERILKIKQALPDSNVNKLWSHTYYTNPEGKGVDVHYCKTIEDCERVIPLFMDDKVVGFDMEWVFPERSATSIRQNVALIQIANESNIALIHVAQMGFNNWGKPLDPDMAIEDVLNLISPTLWKLIESPHIAKVGVNVLGDHRRLRNFLGVRPQGVFELSDLHNLVHATENGISKIPKRLVSLAKQTQLNLGLPLDKGLVRSSDWSRPMTPAQLKYAASDAYVGIRIFDALEVRRQALVPRPPRPALRDIDGPDDLFGAAAEAAEAAGKITATTSTTTTTTITTTGTNATASAEDSGQSSEEAAQSTATLTDEFSAQINMAGEWMTTYTSKFTDGPGPSLSKPQIRAYALWHHGVLDIGDIARIWRDPPLKESTVATYVLEAVMIGRLPCDVQRLKSAHGLISAQLKDRYRGLLARLA